MVEIIFFSERELRALVRKKLHAVSVRFDHHEEYLPDCSEGILVEVSHPDADDELGWLEFSEIVHDHIEGLGYEIKGVRYFTIFEGFGVVAMVKKV